MSPLPVLYNSDSTPQCRDMVIVKEKEAMWRWVTCGKR